MISLWHEGDQIILLKTFCVELSQTIIGIKFESDCLQEYKSPTDHCTEDKLLIYSTQFVVFSSLRIFYQNGTITQCDLKYNCKFNLVYWIIDCVFGNCLCYILNSRNEVIIYDVIKQRISFNAFGPQRCILYSGKFVQYSHNQLIIASGTVFKTILLWGIELDTSENWRLFNIQALHGHDGVIFSVDYNSRFNLLISASDDRSIRIWTGSESSNDTKKVTFWKKNLFDSAHTYYGHKARIWKILSFSLPKPVIISCGEDSSILVWSLLPPYRIVQKKSLFRNNRIWCFEILQHCVAFGGSDSSIKFIDIDELLAIDNLNLPKKCFQLTLPKAICYTQVKPTTHRIFSFSTKGDFRLMSEEGDLEKTYLSSNVPLENIFNDYICVAYNGSRTNVVIGSKSGHVGLLSVVKENLNLVYIEKLFNSKIFDVSFVSEDNFICCLAEGQISMFSLEGGTLKIQQEYCFVLPATRHPWTSCGVLQANVLIVGDYSGNMFAFKANLLDPISQFRHIHGPNGTTCVQRHATTNLIYSSGRNGKIIEYLLEEVDGQIISLQYLRIFVLFPEMDWIGGFHFDSCSPYTLKYVYGFESKNFHVWDLVENRIVFQEECGGGHRSWDLVIDSQNGKAKLSFAYSSKNKLKCVQHNLPSRKVCPKLTYSSLPRKINCCTLLYQSSDFIYFLVAGEDTYIQVVRYSNLHQSIELWATLFGHISNVSAIKCLPLILQHGKQTIEAVSVGGRSQLIVWRFIIDDNGQLLCMQRAIDFLGMTSHLNNQSLFEEHTRKLAKELDIDIRYLDVDFCLSSNSTHDFLILVACSDCAFRLYRFSGAEKRISDSKKIPNGTSCLLLARLLGPDFHLPHLICALASSDGYLSLWSMKETETDLAMEREASLCVKLHQAGINSMDFQWHNGRWLSLAECEDALYSMIMLLTMYIRFDRHPLGAYWWRRQLPTALRAGSYSNWSRGTVLCVS